MAKIRILVVDDHAIIRDGIRALLNLYDDLEIVGEAEDGKAGVEKTLELLPDVVIMDIGMPVMDGLEATRRIAKKNPEIKILVLTQHDNKEYILSAIRAGVSGYIPKKALGSDLVSAIRAVNRGDSFLFPSATTVLIGDYLKQADKPAEDLTEREREVLKLIAEGHTSRIIAEKLFINLKTVLGHRAKIMQKLDIHNRSELVKYAIRKGFISMES